MLRGNPASSMQKTYDEVYLVCSTAIYFEQQNNEAEALRSWREGLDQIYYHNAYKIPANYRPKTETEKALLESLRDLELQCKERVDLFDTLRQSRQEAMSKSNDSLTSQPPTSRIRTNGSTQSAPNTLGHGSVPPSSYSSLSRPPLPTHRSSQPSKAPELPNRSRSDNVPPPANNESSAATLKPPETEGGKPSRSPSPEKRSMFRSTLRPERKDRQGNAVPRLAQTMRPRPPRNAAAAATLAWPGQSLGAPYSIQTNGSSTSLAEPSEINSRKASVEAALIRQSHDNQKTSRSPNVSAPHRHSATEIPQGTKADDSLAEKVVQTNNRHFDDPATSHRPPPPPPPPHRSRRHPPPCPNPSNDGQKEELPIAAPPPPPTLPSYRKEYPAPTPIDARKAASISRNPPGHDHDRIAPLRAAGPSRDGSPPKRQRPAVQRRAVGTSSPSAKRREGTPEPGHSSENEIDPSGPRQKPQKEEESLVAELPGHDVDAKASNEASWDARVKHLMENLPKGVDKDAAKAIFNEIVIKGDEVQWEDVAGLDVAKNALKEAVVYPFLRPDLFMGLREPARGMLLFGPPGTGKTMLARAVATESHSTFFAISASSLTSKYLGESEKLVRALFMLAKALTPSIIFVDEIDSLLSARAGSGEHEATRRIKTEFLIQWSDLAKAAAGREQADGDASRVLVLAATNLPWAIDEAARRRFVRRQYIPLPEEHVRVEQLKRLMSAQKHSLGDGDFERLVALTDGFSGSDITALAKDAAMGPLRSLGEQLLHMSPEDIRPINIGDFEASLVNIRPSVSKQGLKEFEDWAREFGERGG